MAHQAVRHGREQASIHFHVRGNPEVAGLTAVTRGFQKLPLVEPRRTEVSLLVNCRRDERRRIAELGVLGVRELAHDQFPLLLYSGRRALLVTRIAGLRGREEIVGHLRAGSGGRMALRAGELKLQMELVGERPCREGRPAPKQENYLL